MHNDGFHAQKGKPHPKTPASARVGPRRMREVQEEPRTGASQGEKSVIAAGDTYAAAWGQLLCVYPTQ
jgi:hypothetical protein